VSGASKASQHDAEEPRTEELSEPGEASDEPTGDSARGAPLANRYRLLVELGAGGQGHTFLARDERRNAEVAIKRFDLRAATDWKKVELFERECSVLRSITHPAIPRYLDQFEQDGVFYLVMERVVGESLQERRSRGVRMTEAEVWRVLHEVGAILDMLHGLQPPIIHRDIKPHNLLRRPDGTIALVDFGAVRDMLRAGGGSTVAGTFGYMAPEQLHGQALAQTDVYGLGATIVALMTGREPEQLRHKGLRLDIRSEVSASPALLAVVERMLEPDPDHRPKSVRAAMGAHAPSQTSPPTSAASAAPSPSAAPTPSASEQLGRPQSGGLEALSASLPLPIALTFSLGILLLSVPFWVLGVVAFPLLSLVLKGGPGGSMREASRWLMGVQAALVRASAKASRAASEAFRLRSDQRMRRRVDSRLRAKHERQRARQQAEELKRQWRDNARSQRRR
jgi:serine/threonine protein kinase